MYIKEELKEAEKECAETKLKFELLQAFTAGWDSAKNNKFSIRVNFDNWYHKKFRKP